MKKTFAMILLAAALAASLAACSMPGTRSTTVATEAPAVTQAPAEDTPEPAPTTEAPADTAEAPAGNN